MMEELDMYALCRICLEKSYFKCDIFKTCSMDGYLVYDVINAVCELGVSLDDGLPQFLCSECLRKVMDFKLFKTKAHQGRLNFLLMKKQMENAITRQDVDVNCSSNDAISWPEEQPNEIGMQAEIKQEEVDVDCSSDCEISRAVEQNNENGTQVNHGPIPLKYEVLPFNRDANQQESEVACDGIVLQNVEGNEDLPQESEVDCDGIVLQNIEGKEDLPQDCQDRDIGANQGKFESSTMVRRQIRKNDMMKCSTRVKSGRNVKVVVKHPSEAKELKESEVDCDGIVLQNIEGNEDLPQDCQDHDVGADQGNFESSTMVRRQIRKNDTMKCRKPQVKRGRNVKVVVKRPSEAKELKVVSGDVRKFVCITCHKGFNNITALRRHKLLHFEGKTFECNESKTQFNLKSNLVKHVVDKPHECHVCKKTFNTKSSLVNHSRLHTGDKPFKCKACGRKFNQKGNLMSHLRWHTGDKLFECKECGKRFHRKGNLESHSRTHTRFKPFECKECGKKFAGKRYFYIHSMVHTGLRPFECKNCGKRFTQKGNLLTHSRLHTGQKPFECKKCRRTFNQRGNLLKHSCLYRTKILLSKGMQEI